MRDVELPLELETIGDDSFHGCASLPELVFPYGFKEVGNTAFCGCSSLRKLTFPASLEKIGDRAFTKCPPDLTFCGPVGSFVEKYARKKKRTFEAI